MIANEHAVYVRMYTGDSGIVRALAIMIDNDILQTKYVVGSEQTAVKVGSLSIGDSLHIVIENVTKHMGTTENDAVKFNDPTKITIGSGSDPYAMGTWTSTIKPDNETVELDCKVVNYNNPITTIKCDSDNYWPDSVFNRIPIGIVNIYTQFGSDSDINHAMFGTDSLSFVGSVPSGWNEYNVTGSGSYLTIDNRVTIMGLPESFVSHWVNTIHAKAYMGNGYMMLVPPDQ